MDRVFKQLQKNQEEKKNVETLLALFYKQFYKNYQFLASAVYIDIGNTSSVKALTKFPVYINILILVGLNQKY